VSRNFELLQDASFQLDAFAPDVPERHVPDGVPPIAEITDEPKHVDDFKPAEPKPPKKAAEPDPVRPDPGKKVPEPGPAKNFTKETHQGVKEPRQDSSSRLIQSLFFSSTQSAPQFIVFAGVDSPRSCSWICVQEAESLARRKGVRVALVGASEVPDSTFLHASHSLHASRPGKTKSPGQLHMLSFALTLQNSHDLRRKIDQLRRQFDYVFLDCPPVLHHRDAAVFGQLADGVVLVLDVNGTSRQNAIQATQHLRSSSVKILGAILNTKTFPA
jgi:hypothetical protein